jgi:hypothetical protein
MRRLRAGDVSPVLRNLAHAIRLPRKISPRPAFYGTSIAPAMSIIEVLGPYRPNSCKLLRCIGFFDVRFPGDSTELRLAYSLTSF